MSRARTCGSASICSIVLTGPAGTPAASSAASHAAEGLRLKRNVSSATSASRFAIRSLLSAKRGSSRQLGRLEHLRQSHVVDLVRRADGDPAVAGLERLVRRGHRMRGAERPDLAAAADENRALPERLHHAGFEQRRVDQLALAALQQMHVGADDAERAEDAGVDVGDRRADLGRRSARIAGDAHQPGKPLRDQVEAALGRVGAGQAVAGQGAVDQPRIGSAQHVVAEAQPFHRADAEVFDDDIGAVDDPPQRRVRRRVLQVERDAPLVAVHHHERARLAVDFGRREAPRVVAVGHALDLDHVGAHVGEQHAARSGPT